MGERQPHILLTNDDGVQAPGLLALADALSPFADLTIIAPDRNWSASGHVKTMHKPLRVKETVIGGTHTALETNGAPSDAVALGLMGLAREPVDLVIAGINAGVNLGQDVTYSGTVTAAMEGVIGEVPSVAVSLCVERAVDPDYGPAAGFAAYLAHRILSHGLPERILLNVNVPCCPRSEIRGVRVTRMGLRVYHDELVRREDPYGRPYYWIGGEPPSGFVEEGTDIEALAHGYVSVTPIRLDFTAYAVMDTLQDWAWSRWRDGAGGGACADAGVDAPAGGGTHRQ
jgi:5'-nucleotidase